MIHSTFWQILCLDSLERANGNLTFNYFSFPWKCRASSSVLMGKLKQHLPPRISPDNDLFLAMFLILLPPSMRDSRSWRPWNGRSHGEGCGHPMGRSGRPGSYSCSRLDTPKQEPRSQQREERRQKGRKHPHQKSPPFPPRFPFYSKPRQWHVQISQLLHQ